MNHKSTNCDKIEEMMVGRILIADDIATNRIILKARLRAAAYQTQQVATGSEALQQVRISAPDAILVAQDIDDGSGIDLCRRLRATLGLTRTPIILMSSDETLDTRLAALNAGIDCNYGSFARRYDVAGPDSQFTAQKCRRARIR